jgi:hypothetical protein
LVPLAKLLRGSFRLSTTITSNLSSSPMDTTSDSPPSENIVGQGSLSTTDSSASEFGLAPQYALHYYYVGLPSRPRMIAYSGIPPWKRSRELGEQNALFPVSSGHPINNIWETELSAKIVAYLDSEAVEWSSIDVVRMGHPEVVSSRRNVLWIGVIPESLQSEKGAEVARGCSNILLDFVITDVNVEIRESRVMRSASNPKLLAPAWELDPTARCQKPLTATLGISLSSSHRPSIEGTGGFFVAEGGGSNRIFLISTRHTFFEDDDNELYEFTNSSSCRHILLLGALAMQTYKESIDHEIFVKRKNLGRLQAYLDTTMASSSNERLNAGRDAADREIKTLNQAIKSISHFRQEVLPDWDDPDHRVLGHVLYSPPIEYGVGADKCTQDFVVIEVDRSRLDEENFRGNLIDLGFQFELWTLQKAMHLDSGDSSTSDYFDDRLLTLRDLIPEQEMRRPPAMDSEDDEPCIMVLKHGHASKLTIGRANTIRSIVRYDADSEGKRRFAGVSMEWTILPCHDKESVFSTAGAFSKKGDSGAVIVDGKGRIGGMLTGGGGSDRGRDVTYATSIHCLMQLIKKRFPEAHLYPILE